MRLRWWLLFVGALVIVGCSSPDATAPHGGGESPTTTSTAIDGAQAPASSASPADTAPSDSDPSDEEPADLEPSDEDSQPAGSVAPIEAYDPDDEQPPAVSDPSSAWISRRWMSESSIEVVWSATDDAVSYEVHRVVRISDSPPDASAMTADTVVHTSDDKGVFIDEGVTAGTIYWHGIRGLGNDGTVLSVGWHPTAAVTDEQPPEPVDVSLEQADGSVLLTWQVPAENYQLHSYQIRRSINGGEAEVVGQTWQLDQTSFLDDEPPTGVVTYSVISYDFHWNLSEPTEVTVELS